MPRCGDNPKVTAIMLSMHLHSLCLRLKFWAASWSHARVVLVPVVMETFPRAPIPPGTPLEIRGNGRNTDHMTECIT